MNDLEHGFLSTFFYTLEHEFDSYKAAILEHHNCSIFIGKTKKMPCFGLVDQTELLHYIHLVLISCPLRPKSTSSSPGFQFAWNCVRERHLLISYIFLRKDFKNGTF